MSVNDSRTLSWSKGRGLTWPPYIPVVPSLWSWCSQKCSQQMRPGFWGPERGLGEQGSRKGVHREVALDSAPCSVLSNLCVCGVGWWLLCVTKWESIVSQISIHGEILGRCSMKTGLCHAGEIVSGKLSGGRHFCSFWGALAVRWAFSFKD